MPASVNSSIRSAENPRRAASTRPLPSVRPATFLMKARFMSNALLSRRASYTQIQHNNAIATAYLSEPNTGTEMTRKIVRVNVFIFEESTGPYRTRTTRTVGRSIATARRELSVATAHNLDPCCPRGLKLIQEAGENGLDAVKLINSDGDDAVWVISKPK